MGSGSEPIAPPAAKVYIFDVDGTLYDLRRVRVRMALELSWAMLSGKISLRDLMALRKYRKEREKLAGLSMPGLKHAHFSLVAAGIGISERRLFRLVSEWIYKRPLKHLEKAKYRSTFKYIMELRRNGSQIFFYSDYPLLNKMRAMGYDFPGAYFSSLDQEVSSFKPHTRFLEYLCTAHGYKAADLIFVGDRADRDKALADAFGCRYLDISEFNRVMNKMERPKA